MAERPDMKKIAFIGFGEAATAFVSGWPVHDAGIAAYDIKTEEAATRDAMRARYDAHGVEGADDRGRALAGATVVFSTVTADQALVAAERAAPHLVPGGLWLDCNSCAPQTKARAAEVIEQAGGRYVDVAVMAPVHPLGCRVPLLVSGPDAAAAVDHLEVLGMCPRLVGDKIGQASAIKMLRSVMIKGFEALTTECFLAARRAGVEGEVLASLEASDPDIAWRRRGTYNLDRMMVHGARRAAEMAEVARTVAGLGLPASMSDAAAFWQKHVADIGAEPQEDDDLWHRADRVLSGM